MYRPSDREHASRYQRGACRRAAATPRRPRRPRVGKRVAKEPESPAHRPQRRVERRRVRARRRRRLLGARGGALLGVARAVSGARRTEGGGWVSREYAMSRRCHARAGAYNSSRAVRSSRWVHTAQAWSTGGGQIGVSSTDPCTAALLLSEAVGGCVAPPNTVARDAVGAIR
jgi:hypothetical protein